MKKIGNLLLNDGNTICIYYDNHRGINKYALYVESYYQDDKHEYPTTHRKLIARYANLASCTAHIHNFVQNNDEESR